MIFHNYLSSRCNQCCGRYCFKVGVSGWHRHMLYVRVYWILIWSLVYFTFLLVALFALFIDLTMINKWWTMKVLQIIHVCKKKCLIRYLNTVRKFHQAITRYFIFVTIYFHILQKLIIFIITNIVFIRHWIEIYVEHIMLLQFSNISQASSNKNQWASKHPHRASILISLA